MTTAYDPYEDDDAVNIDMSMAYAEEESPFSRTLKQMGQAIKSGQFCKIPKEEEIVKQEKTMPPDVTMDMTVVDDSQHETLTAEKSVSFSEADPLIVDDISSMDEFDPQEKDRFEDELKPDEVEVQEPQSASEVVTEEVVKEEVFQDITVEKTDKSKSSGSALAIAVVLLSVCIGVYKYNHMNTINVLNQMYSAVVSCSATIQSNVKERSGLEMPKLIFGSISSLGLLAILKNFIADEKKLTSFMEFVWGVFVCSLVMTGMYFTYDLTVE